MYFYNIGSHFEQVHPTLETSNKFFVFFLFMDFANNLINLLNLLPAFTSLL